MRHPLFCLVLALTTACTDTPTPEPVGDGSFVRGRFRDWIGFGVGGVNVCQQGGEPCTETETDGTFLLEGLPLAEDIVIMLDREDFYPTALPHHSADTEPDWDKNLLSVSNMETVANRVNTELQPGRGHMSFMVHQEHFREGKVDQTKGVRFSIEPDPGSQLYYLNSLQLPDPDLEETTGGGGGGALNLPPGDYELVLEHPVDCERIISWTFPAGNRIPFTIYPDRATYFDLLCPEPS